MRQLLESRVAIGLLWACPLAKFLEGDETTALPERGNGKTDIRWKRDQYVCTYNLKKLRDVIEATENKTLILHMCSLHSRTISCEMFTDPNLIQAWPTFELSATLHYMQVEMW